jgi:hypothetical protein
MGDGFGDAMGASPNHHMGGNPDHQFGAG